MFDEVLRHERGVFSPQELTVLKDALERVRREMNVACPNELAALAARLIHISDGSRALRADELARRLTGG